MSADGSNSKLSPGTKTGTLTLHLGVAVVAYRPKGKKISSVTTGDVAQILEDNYGLMAAFYRVHHNDVAQAIEKSLGGALESLLMGQTVDPWGSATQAINQEFRDFVTSREAEHVGIAGTPTKAAQAGINQRRKHPYRKSNPSRPSFYDSHLFVNSFRSWID